MTGQPKSVRTEIPLPLNEPPSRADLVAQTGRGRETDKYNAATQLARLDRGESLLRQIDYPIQTWTFGDSFCMNFLAGEVCVDYALRLKSLFDHERFWLNAYSNDFCSYIPSERLVREGGYGGGSEVPYFALPSTLKSGLEQLIVDEVLRQVPDSFLASKGTQGVSPKTPESSLQCMRIGDHLRVELVAAEPQVEDPVAIDFGPDGRLWVAEMNDYGRGVYEQFDQNSRVRWLRDDNGDGRFEVAETFVDGLRFPTDVKVWRDGILICDAPDIKFARDTDGDGKANDIKTLFSGFEVRNAQARVNSLRWGLDGWLYGSCGLFGGVITSHLTQETVDCRNRDFRLNPDNGVIEPVDGRTQQGRCRNDWGDWFGCSNGTLLQAIPSENVPTGTHPLTTLLAPKRLSLSPGALKLYPPDNLVRFELSGAPGQATSACGLGIYRDTLLGAAFIGDAFTCEPVHQSVHRIDLSRAGHGYTGSRGAGEEAAEFLSSSDRWFRPVQVRTGPRGALWVVDMYRYVIEHSRWIPQSTLKQLDVFAGQRRGRIYRVVPAETSAKIASQSAIPVLSKLSDKDLAAHLGSTNGTVRDLVHQMLQWRSAEGADDEIRRVAADEQNSAAQIQALATLAGLKRLSAADVSSSLRSGNAETVRFSVRLAEHLIEESAEIQSLIVGLANHGDVRVRRQVALSIAAADFPSAVPTLTRLMSSDEPDAYVRSAALSSVDADNVNEVITAYLSDPANRTAGTFDPLILLALRRGDTDARHKALDAIMPNTDNTITHKQAQTIAAALDALDARENSDQVVIERATSNRLLALHQSALRNIADADPSVDSLMGSLALLGRHFGRVTDQIFRTDANSNSFDVSTRAAAIASLISPTQPASVQQQAVQALSQIGSNNVSALLLDAYPRASPALRSNILDSLISHDSGSAALLAALSDGRVRNDALDAIRRQKLLTHPNEQIRLDTERILHTSKTSSRSDVVKSFDHALDRKGNATAGQAVFRKHCSNCHKLQEDGFVVGPNLLALTNRDPRWLLTAILDPNRDVDDRYIMWTAVTFDGRAVSGLIVDETSTGIRLREAGGKENVIDRSEIDLFRSSNLSVMPEGLEKDINAQQMSDVIAYLIENAPPAKDIPGNRPVRVEPDDRGILSLTAARAEIRGGEITFESQFSNIGYWHHENDSATWTFSLPNDASYDVYLNAACAGSVAGNRFRIEGLDQPLFGTVASTGGWDRYRPTKVTNANLQAGEHTVVVRSEGEIRGALFDLKEVRLVPANSPPKFEDVDASVDPLPRHPPEIAPFLLDESQPTERREQVIHDRPGMGPAILSLLVRDLNATDLAEQYRRIPWIWRVAIAVGKRNDGGEIRDLLEFSVPVEGQRLLDWQAVVIGGGLINGVSQIGLSPKNRFGEVLAGLPSVKERWPAVLKLAALMADDEAVKAGTRYDALRMVALQAPDAAIVHLQKYLKPEADRQLQMGAVSGLIDVESAQADALLSDALSWLKGQNRWLALEGMLRTDARANHLAELLRSGRLSLEAGEADKLIQHSVSGIKTRANALPGVADSR